MGVPTSEVGYTSATTRRGDHEVHKGHVVALEGVMDKSIKFIHKSFNELTIYLLILIGAILFCLTL
jgi:hypothetical protein